MSHDPVVIVSAVRTPIGNFQGVFKDITATELGAIAIKAAYQRAGLKPEQIDEVLMGCVLPAGLGQAPARQATLGAGLPAHVGATTINKVCGSGLKAVMLGNDLLLAGSQQVVIAGGMESMSNAPYLLPKARAGYRFGHQTVVDHMLLDGLEDAYERGQSMGCFAEQCAEQFGFSRMAQDEFALKSVERARKFAEKGGFSAEVIDMIIPSKSGELTVNADEGPTTARPEKIPQLKPAFKKDGTVTAANSSSISDGAAALVLMRRSHAEQLGLTPLATIVGHATHSHTPALFTTAPITAINKLLTKIQWDINTVDLYEINEAFAVVTMAAMKELNLPADKVNIHGGACVLGHPIGASGARILVTLIHALKTHGLKRGVAALCIGGGEATALAVELA